MQARPPFDLQDLLNTDKIEADFMEELSRILADKTSLQQAVTDTNAVRDVHGGFITSSFAKIDDQMFDEKGDLKPGFTIDKRVGHSLALCGIDAASLSKREALILDSAIWTAKSRVLAKRNIPTADPQTQPEAFQMQLQMIAGETEEIKKRIDAVSVNTLQRNQFFRLMNPPSGSEVNDAFKQSLKAEIELKQLVDQVRKIREVYSGKNKNQLGRLFHRRSMNTLVKQVEAVANDASLNNNQKLNKALLTVAEMYQSKRNKKLPFLLRTFGLYKKPFEYEKGNHSLRLIGLTLKQFLGNKTAEELKTQLSTMDREQKGAILNVGRSVATLTIPNDPKLNAIYTNTFPALAKPTAKAKDVDESVKETKWQRGLRPR